MPKISSLANYLGKYVVFFFHFFEIFIFSVLFPYELAKNIFQKMKFVALGITYTCNIKGKF